MAGKSPVPRNNQAFDAAFEQAASNGMKPNGKIVEAGVFRVMYVNDRNHFSVEIINARKSC